MNTVMRKGGKKGKGRVKKKRNTKRCLENGGGKKKGSTKPMKIKIKR